MGERLIVVGGDAAGMSAASKAKRDRPEMEVVVFERQNYVSYGLCGLPYYIAGVVKRLKDLVAITPQKFREKRDIDVRLNHEVVRIDPEGKYVVVKNGEGEEFETNYDTLLIATGAHARVPSMEGVDLENIFTLHWLDDGRKIKNFIEEKDPKRVAVGAGYIGLEMAETFTEMGLDVTVLAKYDHVLPMVDPEVAQPLEKKLTERGIDIQKESRILAFEGDGDGKVQKVITERGEVEVDFVLLGIGVEPTVELAEEAGIKIGDTGAIAVNERMETNADEIYAAGDCVETDHIVSGKRVNIPLGDTANRQGRVAGTNIAGGNASFPGVLGTAITKIFDLGVARTGFNEVEAKESKFDYITSTITTASRAFYYPGGSPIVIKLIVEKDNGRLLGAQMAGEEGVSQRIDVFASLIYNEMPVQEIQNLDFGYVPPYSPAWDPVQTAAKVAASKLKRS